MNGKAEEHVAAKGSWGTVNYAICSNGKSPAKEFVESREESDKRKIAALFQFMANSPSGKISNDEKFSHEDGAIWSFKAFQIRLPCFQDGKSWIVTHGFIKKKDKWPPGELERAKRIRNEHLERKQAEEKTKKGSRRI